MTDSAGPVAAFDFDGTLSRRDTLVPFLARLRGPQHFARAASGALMQLRSADRDHAKAALLRRLVTGMDHADYLREARAYGRGLCHHLRPDVRARLDQHLERGHHVLIVSASLRGFLQPVAEELGVHDLIATELAVDADGRLSGELAGANVRAEEKPRRLLERLGGRPSELWAYGNSSGDAALLALADHPIWVRGRRPLAPLEG